MERSGGIGTTSSAVASAPHGLPGDGLDPSVAGLGLRAAGPADWELISGWLRLPEIQLWWGDQASAAAEVRIALETPSALCTMITVDDRCIGYAHAIDAAAWGSVLPEAMPAGSWDADLFIAVPEYRGRGLGARALRLLAADVFATTLAPAISVFASVRNEAAVRAYEKAGFRWVRICNDPIFGPAWMMLLHRPATAGKPLAG